MVEDEVFIDPQSPIMITGYQIRDPIEKKVFFSVGQCFGADVGEAMPIEGMNPQLGIKYVLPKDFLNSKQIASQCQFSNLTDQPLANFVLEEVHYIQDKKLQEFKFNLGFVPPHTTNTWEHMYEPEFKRNSKFIEAAVKGPWNVDTKLYIDGKCVMYTKAQLTFK